MATVELGSPRLSLASKQATALNFSGMLRHAAFFVPWFILKATPLFATLSVLTIGCVHRGSSTMRNWTFLGIWVLGGSLLCHAAELTAKVQVTGDRVNIRAGANSNKEVMFQVNAGQELVATAIEGDWVQVVPPKTCSVWVYGKYVQDSIITADKVNIRAGSNINYTPVGQVGKGTSITVLGTKGDWVQIEPPDTVRVWVHKSLVRVVEEVASVAGGHPDIAEAPDAALAVIADPTAGGPVLTPIVEEPVVAAVPVVIEYTKVKDGVPASLTSMGLIPVKGQGDVSDYTGKLRWTSDLLIKRPSELRLVSIGPGRSVTTCSSVLPRMNCIA